MFVKREIGINEVFVYFLVPLEFSKTNKGTSKDFLSYTPIFIIHSFTIILIIQNLFIELYDKINGRTVNNKT